MAVLFSESSKLNQNQLRAGIIQKFAETSPIIEMLDQITVQGNAYAYNVSNAYPGVAWRAVNGSYTEGAGTYTSATEPLFIVGGDLDVDAFIVDTQGEQVRSSQTAMKSKALAYEYDRVFIHGDNVTNPTEPNGLNARITGSQVITADTAGVTTNGGVLTLKLLDRLMLLVVGRPDLFLTFRGMQLELKGLLQNNLHYLEDSKDAFGRDVMGYNGVPLRTLDENDRPTAVLNFNETQGSTSLAGSVYAIKLGADEYIAGIQSSKGFDVRDLGELESKPSYRTRVEWYCSFVMQHPRSAARLKGVIRA